MTKQSRDPERPRYIAPAAHQEPGPRPPAAAPRYRRPRESAPTEKVTPAVVSHAARPIPFRPQSRAAQKTRAGEPWPGLPARVVPA